MSSDLKEAGGMDAARKQIDALLSAFEDARHENEHGAELWFGRELMRLFEYKKWENFRQVLHSAWQACASAGTNPAGHFWQAANGQPWDPDSPFIPEVGKKSGKGRPSEDVMISRYAAYLAAQNADPSKAPVAFAQRYFAEQTRRHEIADQSLEALSEDQRRILIRTELTEQNKGLASAAASVGVRTPKDFAYFQTAGYQGMYGGLNVEGIKRAKGISGRDAILDRMGSTEMAANLFRLTQAEEKLRKQGAATKAQANQMHHAVGVEVRNTMKRISGTVPEKLPPADHIRNAEKRIKALTSQTLLPGLEKKEG